jgi:putative DNA primase/helicase
VIATGFTVDEIPSELRQRRQWVAWRVEMRPDRTGAPRATKVPVDARTGRNASATNPATWTDFNRTVDYAQRHDAGIGYVFAADDPYSGVDLDKCRDPQSGAITAWTHGVIQLLDSYTEVSPSATGVKIFIRAKLVEAAGRRRGPVELYSSSRFFTVTGQRLSDSPRAIQDRQAQLDALVQRLFPPPPPVQPRRSGTAIADDVELIERAMRARNGDRFARLWRGDWGGRYASQSEADAALCAHLAYWTDGDAARVDALFRQSGLCRSKWTDRDDYRERTINRVLH